MDSLECRPKPLETQVAGRHKSSTQSHMLDIGNGFVLKTTQAPPRGPTEIEFYKKVFDPKLTDDSLLALRPLLPQYYDTLVYDDATYLKLENITGKFKKPSVLDVKIGAMSWDPHATDAKIQQEKSKFPPAQTVGFRFAGMRIYDQESDSFEFLGKDYCYSLTLDTILTKGFGRFFTQASKIQKTAVRDILNKLKDIEKWMKSQRHFAFYCSSLLLVYESSLDSRGTLASVEDSCESHGEEDTKPGTKWDSKSQRPATADVRMIDFAHVFPSDKLDDNYLHGLQNVTSFLTQLLES